MSSATRTKEITVILPCAGEGSRLGLKTPKELLAIFTDDRRPAEVKLIDFSLAHIRTFPRPENLRVAVVVRPWKMAVFEYVTARLPGIEVKPVLFDEHYQEWPGSVYSAAPCFSKDNLVLLPDSYLQLPEPHHSDSNTNQTLLEKIQAGLRNTPVVFGYVPCTDQEILHTLGALRVENNQVIAFQDKPNQDVHLYNAFWGCYGFRGEVGHDLYNFLWQSVSHQTVFLEKQSFFPPGAVPLARYYDLGTWERITAFREQFPTLNRFHPFNVEN